MTIRYVESSKLPTSWGMFEMHGFEEVETGKEHVVLSMGDLDTDEPVLARIHSECLTGDALFSLRCDCGAQLQHALHRIATEGRGAVFYLGADTVEANEQLGFGADMRDYSILKPMIDHLGIQSIRLMTNNPRKVKALQDLGVEVTERLPHQSGRNPHNVNYLSTKKGKLGHLFDDEDGSEKA